MQRKGRKAMNMKKRFRSDRVLCYFQAEWKVLLAVTLSGLIYNLGLLAGPWFEGEMAACLIDILNGDRFFSDMLALVLAYVCAIGVVQFSRYIKRFYVRRFANNVNRRMKHILYGSLVQKSRRTLSEEGAGNVMTKAILDVDDCAEGMRKFTTEIFDTGVALLAYAAMLLFYDWRLALISMIFPPVSYAIAEKMKGIVQRTGAAFKEQSGALSAATLDRATNAVTYRVFGCEQERSAAYEENLSAYERSAVRANIWNASLPPIYRIISMAGLVFILYFGGRNVLGQGWTAWDIAAFTTFVSCFTRLAVKSSSAAKLFNAVHKAQVSWQRIRPLMYAPETPGTPETGAPASLTVQGLGFAYPGNEMLFSQVSFAARPGQIIGVTGPVACGKSSLGKAFLCEYPYRGSIRLGNKELAEIDERTRLGEIGYLGHDPELFNDTIEHNVLMGDKGDAWKYLRLVCLDEEIKKMPEGIHTLVGNGGVRLSGGQAQRLALARTLCHKKPLLILDDPFSALDRNTERKIFENLKTYAADSVVLLISHRLYLFPEMEQVIWLKDGQAIMGSHEEVKETVPEYAQLISMEEETDSTHTKTLKVQANRMADFISNKQTVATMKLSTENNQEQEVENHATYK